MNTEKERQHYVPKFYLRYFSYLNNKKQIGVFNTATLFFYHQAKLKTQAYKPFFYGKDGEIEEMLADVENKLSPLIVEITLTQSLPVPDSLQHYSLLLFAILTELRNPVAANSVKDQRKELVRRIIELAPADIDKKLSEESLPEISSEENIRMAFLGMKQFLHYSIDLQFKLLLNKTSVPFITSDNPIIKYNQYSESKNWSGQWTGYATMGLQIFAPITPELAVVFYDGWTYKIGDKKKDIIEIKKEDVDQLNILQILNCDSQVFFNEKVTKTYIEHIFKLSKRFKKPNDITSKLFKKSDQHNRAIESDSGFAISIGLSDLKTRLQLSEFAVTKQAKRYVPNDYVVQLRSWPKKILYSENKRS